jgi:predicted O-methyltransferase YrrM
VLEYVPGRLLLHWVLYGLGLERAQTQTTDEERGLLARYAAGSRVVVELGVFEGVTARLLRGALAEGGELWCIDPFPAGRLGFSYALSIARREVEGAGWGQTKFIRLYSFEAAPAWQQAIDFLFIDADHAYEAVRRDWEDWSPFVRPGGHVALHDSQECARCDSKADTGPVRLVREVLESDERFALVATVDSLTVLERW